MTTTPARLVIAILGLVLLTAVDGIIWLTAQGHPVPDVLQNVAVGSLTGLVGLLVPIRGGGGPTA
jgi:hypothetical protein